MNPYFIEIFNQALESYHFNRENGTTSLDSGLKILNSVVTHLYGLAFCLEDEESLRFLRLTLEELRSHKIPRPISRFNTTIWS